MKRTHKDAEEAEYTRTRDSPFNQCSGRPDWKCYLKIKRHATKVACRLEVDYDWVTTNLGHKFGLMVDILGEEEYENVTSIDCNDYDPSLAKPAVCDVTITAATNYFQREKRTATRNEELRWWYVHRGLHRGLREIFMDALDSAYYEQLENDINITGYETVGPKIFWITSSRSGATTWI